MDVETADAAVAAVAAAIGEPARTRMLYGLLDGRARTSTELAAIAGVTPSTASVHLQRLSASRLVAMQAQGRHRYYRLDGAHVAAALEALNVVAGAPRRRLTPAVPARLRVARSCYDHLAGSIGVGLHDRLIALGWLARPRRGPAAYAITPAGREACAALGIDIEAARSQRRRFAFPCLDWSERRPHLGGALAASFLALALQKKWVVRHLDSRALDVTTLGRRELRARFDLQVDAAVDR